MRGKPLKPRFRLFLKDEPQVVYETRQPAFSLGRSDECDIVINDPYISRIQARGRFEDRGYYLENVGRNPIFINDKPSEGQFLTEGDAITFGTTTLIFHPEKPEDRPAANPSQTEKTVVLRSLPEENLTPRLVLTLPTGNSQTYPLETERFLIGRSAEADICLEDASISRRHCSVEKQDDVYSAGNLSPTNPTFVNGEEISKARLYNGDILRIGPFFLTFISERPLDVKKDASESEARKSQPGWGLLLTAACLLCIFGGYLFYWRAYRPWRNQQDLESVREQIVAEDYESAYQHLKRLLDDSLGPEQDHLGRELLTQTVLAVTQQMEADHTPAEVKAFLTAHLKDYGAGSEAEALWDRLDLYRLQLGRGLESNRQYQAALSQYGAVREDSVYSDEAQKGIRRIWLATQQDRHKHQRLDGLLEKAERHFAAKRYLIPVNKNAYSIYQTILGLDPENEIARQRIEQMKLFYRGHGDRSFNQGDWRRALSFYERYHLIDPDAGEIKKQIAACRDKLSEVSASSEKPPGKKTPDKMRDRVKRLLEESGTESTWIMKYLFEEQSGEVDSETPW